jgi:2'-5' RNA ligase
LPEQLTMSAFAQESWRTFIAIELAANVRAQIARHIQTLRQQFPDVRASWVREENLHLTLKFLGEVSVEDIQKLSTAAASAAAAINPFALSILGPGTFPPHGQPKVLWIGIEDEQRNLIQLQARLEDECVRLGFARESRSFHPHLTIARVRSPKGSRQLAQSHKDTDFPFQNVSVSEIVLFRSELRSEGSKHTALSRHPLRPGS